jgi:hypothetical protein
MSPRRIRSLVSQPRLVSRHTLCFALHELESFRCDLPSQFRLQSRQLRLNFFSCFALPDNLLAVAPQEVIDGLDANPDRSRGLVLIEILEAEVRSTRLLDNATRLRHR